MSEHKFNHKFSQQLTYCCENCGCRIDMTLDTKHTIRFAEEDVEHLCASHIANGIEFHYLPDVYCPNCQVNMIQIDSKIADSIMMLWKNGIRTITSCEGHLNMGMSYSAFDMFQMSKTYQTEKGLVYIVGINAPYIDIVQTPDIVKIFNRLKDEDDYCIRFYDDPRNYYYCIRYSEWTRPDNVKAFRVTALPYIDLADNTSKDHQFSLDVSSNLLVKALHESDSIFDEIFWLNPSMSKCDHMTHADAKMQMDHSRELLTYFVKSLIERQAILKEERIDYDK